MYLTFEKKEEIFIKNGGSAQNTGCPESQIALFSFKIAHLTEHLKKNRKDYATTRSLIIMSGKRRKLLKYLQQIDISRYRNIIKELNLRK